MTERERVIRAIECCLKNDHSQCGYESTLNHVTGETCMTKLLRDVLEVLENIEPYIPDEPCLNRGNFVRVGDILDCFKDLNLEKEANFHAVMLMEWAMQKRSRTVDEVRQMLVVPTEDKPRVMTLEELRGIADANLGIWPYDTPPYLSMETESSFNWVETQWVAWRDIARMIRSQHITYTAENYGRAWRVWSKQPTLMLREEAPWNA